MKIFKLNSFAGKFFTNKSAMISVMTSFVMTSVLISSNAIADTANNKFEEISKELEIMNSILTTALTQSTTDEKIKFRGLQINYLANQGVVFTVGTSGNSWNMRVSGRSYFPAMTAPPSPPLPPIVSKELLSKNSNITWTSQGQMETVTERLRQATNQLRELQAPIRDMTWKLRELEREERDLSFEMRAAETTRTKEIEARLSAIASEQAAIKKQQNAKAAKIEELQKQEKVERQEHLEKTKQASTEFLAAFEKSITGNLCRFGAGLRALPSSQNITFVLDGFNSSIKPQTPDRIYVFSASDMKKCVQEKIDEAKLLANATVYDF
jgi:hypothetical protein